MGFLEVKVILSPFVVFLFWQCAPLANFHPEVVGYHERFVAKRVTLLSTHHHFAHFDYDIRTVNSFWQSFTCLIFAKMVKQYTQRSRTSKKRRGSVGRRKKENIDPSTPDRPDPVNSTQTPTQPITPTFHLFRDPNLTASEKKLSVNNREEQPSQSDSFPTTIVHLEKLKDLFEGVVCRECFEPVELLHDQNSSRGLSICLRVQCHACHKSTSTMTSRNTRSNQPEVNKAWVASGINSGNGCAQQAKMSEVLGMPALSRPTHKKISAQCYDGICNTSRRNMAKARDIVKDLYEPDAEGYYNIPVSFDGTWHKRGHTSKHGAGAVICALTGLVLDAHVMTNFCQVINNLLLTVFNK